MTGARVVQGVAKSFLGIGALLLAFVAFQLWGTAFYEHSAQARLHKELRSSLRAIDKLPKLPAATRGTSPAGTTGTTDPGQTVFDQAAPAVADPPVGTAVGLVSIPAIGVSNAAIIEGTGESQLQQGPGHYPGTPLPGQAGNAAIAGHRTTYGAPFYNLDALKVGDAIDVETPQGLFRYQVTTSKVVDPADVSVLQTTALPELTLTTCNPRYSASQRLIVQALLRTSITNTSFKGTPAAPPSPTRRPTSLAGENTGASQAGSNVSGGVVGAVLWGLLAMALGVAARLAWRRLRGAPRWLGALAVLGGLGSLVMCFQHVSLALPASF